ncbi:MAG: SLBB domain-containing protein [Anaerolineae bacterium]
MKAYRSLWKLAIIILFVLAACAPEDLDITPTPVPTDIPIIKVYVTGAVQDSGKTIELPLGSRVEDAIAAVGGTTDTADLQRVNIAQLLTDGAQVNVPAVGEVVSEATPEAVQAVSAADDPKAFLDKLVELTPANMTGGTIQWRLDPNNPTSYATPRGGNTVRINYIDNSGSLLELTYGIFPDATAAQGYYDAIVGSLQAQVKTAERSEFPTPNQFGEGGTYGSAGIFWLDTLVVRIAIPRFNTVSGRDPVAPLVEPILGYLKEAQGG